MARTITKGGDTLRIGLIGAGAVVRTLHAPILKQLDDVAMAWVYDANRDAARAVAAAFGIPGAHDDLGRCEDVDAVLIAIPVGAREEAWRVAAERKWHVLCEKPAARTVHQFDDVLARMQQAGRVVAFGLMRRFYHGVISLRDLVAARAFGDPIEIWAGEGGAQPRTGRGSDWYQLDRRLSGGGVLIETGSHLIDQILFVAGATKVSLEDYAQRTWQDEPEFDARVSGRLRSRGGADTPFSCVVTRSADVCNGLFVRFPQIVLALPPGPASVVELQGADGRLMGRLHGVMQGPQTSFHAFRDQWAAFLRECREPRPASPIADNALTRLSVDFIERCYERAAADRRDLLQETGHSS